MKSTLGVLNCPRVSMRFKEISQEQNGINDKVLLKELKELKINKIIVRKVYDTFAPIVI